METMNAQHKKEMGSMKKCKQKLKQLKSQLKVYANWTKEWIELEGRIGVRDHEEKDILRIAGDPKIQSNSCKIKQ